MEHSAPEALGLKVSFLFTFESKDTRQGPFQFYLWASSFILVKVLQSDVLLCLRAKSYTRKAITGTLKILHVELNTEVKSEN